MARPSCSRNEPKTLRSNGAIVRRESTKIRDTVELVCAERKRPKARSAEQARPAAIVVCRKPRRLEPNIGQSSRAKARLASCKSHRMQERDEDNRVADRCQQKTFTLLVTVTP